MSSIGKPHVPAAPTPPLELQGPRRVASRRVRRLALGLLTALIASLCSACLTTAEGSPDDIPPVNRPVPSQPTGGVNRPPSSEPTSERREGPIKTLPFGRSFTWDDGGR